METELSFPLSWCLVFMRRADFWVELYDSFTAPNKGRGGEGGDIQFAG